MNTIKSLKYSFMGILLGNAVACTILMLIKEPDFVRFWGYAGYILFPVYIFLIYLFPFVIFKFIKQVFKLYELIIEKDFLIIGLLFSLIRILSDKPFVTLIENIIKRISGLSENSFINNFVYYVLLWFLNPLILFWIIFYLVYIFAKNLRGYKP